MFVATNHQANDPPKNWMSENDALTGCEPDVTTCSYHTNSAKNAAEDSRAEAGSNTTALNFDHISQAERLIKGEKLLRARQQALQF